jgi:hypothetical protein
MRRGMRFGTGFGVRRVGRRDDGSAFAGKYGGSQFCGLRGLYR